MRSAAVFLIVFGLMAIEARRASRNERIQRARGGFEPSGDVYRLMQVAYPAAFAAMIAEGAVRGDARPALIAAGFVLFAAAKALKWWAVLTLKHAWTFRVIVVRGDPLITSGPYTYIRHPNYVAVVGELLSVMLITGAWVAGPLSMVLFGLLMSKRIAVEDEALSTLRARG